jgi:hypothetical protein
MKLFPLQLFYLLEEGKFLRWGDDGTTIILHGKDVDNFENITLPKYFRHNKYSSFQRQLNLYGFRSTHDNKPSIRDIDSVREIFLKGFTRETKEKDLVNFHRRDSPINEEIEPRWKEGLRKRKSTRLKKTSENKIQKKRKREDDDPSADEAKQQRTAYPSQFRNGYYYVPLKKGLLAVDCSDLDPTLVIEELHRASKGWIVIDFKTYPILSPDEYDYVNGRGACYQVVSNIRAIIKYYADERKYERVSLRDEFLQVGSVEDEEFGSVDDEILGGKVEQKYYYFGELHHVTHPSCPEINKCLR